VADGQRAAQVVGTGREPDRAPVRLDDSSRSPTAYRSRAMSGSSSLWRCGRSWDIGDAITENGAAPVQAGQRVRLLACSTWTSCPARGPARDTAEPVFGYRDKAVASCTPVGYLKRR
jgi:hypothetical protein